MNATTRRLPPARRTPGYYLLYPLRLLLAGAFVWLFWVLPFFWGVWLGLELGIAWGWDDPLPSTLSFAIGIGLGLAFVWGVAGAATWLWYRLPARVDLSDTHPGIGFVLAGAVLFAVATLAGYRLP